MFFDLGLAISEAVFLAKYDEYDDGCSHIWKWILAACILNFAAATLTCVDLCKACVDNSNDDNIDVGRSQYIRIPTFVISVWAIITFLNISDSCHDIVTSEMPEIWAFVNIHYVVGWISVGFLAICLLRTVSCCCSNGLCWCLCNPEIGCARCCELTESIYDFTLLGFAHLIILGVPMIITIPKKKPDPVPVQVIQVNVSKM